MSVKFQVTLPEPLLAKMKRESVKRGVSVSELIRQTLEERMPKRHRAAKRDPFASITGIVDSGETDLASRVDEILYR